LVFVFRVTFLRVVFAFFFPAAAADGRAVFFRLPAFFLDDDFLAIRIVPERCPDGTNGLPPPGRPQNGRFRAVRKTP
jgi:hypothetical protein